MTETVIKVLRESTMISAFVFMMMLAVEYLNVVTLGRWQVVLRRRPSLQYAISSFLGATPGCLGAFTVVAFFVHGLVSLGAVVGCMVATSGDESFVMLAMFPRQALMLFGILLLVGMVSAVVTDRLLPERIRSAYEACAELELHTGVERVQLLPSPTQVWSQLRGCTLARGVLLLGLALWTVALVTGQVGPPEWNWVKVTLLVVSAFGLFVSVTAPEHFLEVHLWEHVAKQHLPRVFLWTLGALLALELLTERLDVGAWLEAHRAFSFLILGVACLLGIIPESGPHLIFVTLFARGAIPFSILLASSIVQDGHGMLPLLAHSRRDFFLVKGINLVVGLVLGALLLWAGW